MSLQTSSGIGGLLQVGNASVLEADVQASNGVLQLLGTFPITNAAFNTSMVASLETAGNFGPFNSSQVWSLTTS